MSDNQRTIGRSVRADTLDRAARAWRLRVAGATWDQVAESLGYSDKSAAYHAVRRHFETVPTPDREMAREMWRQRGEVVWRQALTDVLEGKPGAVRAAVALMQRQAALDGLDAPQRHVVTPEAEVLEAYVARLTAGVRGVPVGAHEVEVDILDVDVIRDGGPVPTLPDPPASP